MIFLITGNVGAGKSTYAAALKEKQSGVIFSVDQWNKELFFPDRTTDSGLDWFLERIERSEKIILDLVSQLEASSCNCILDLGLSKKAHRNKFIQFAKEHGYKYEVHFLDISAEIRRQRMLQRNINKGPTYQFEVTEENFNFMERWFEPLDETELQNAIVIKE